MSDPAASPAVPPIVSILVVSFNTRAMTLDCLRSIAEQTRLPHEVVVVDNNSHDGSADAVAAAFPAVRLIRSPENLGFGRANNLAARESRGAYILLLNSDTVVLDNAVDKLVAFAEAMPDAKMWGGRTVFADGTLNPQSCWRLPSLWSIFCRTAGLNAIFPGSALFHSEAYAGWPRDSVRSVGMIVGCFLMTTRTLWDELGGFDERLFMYSEDTDLCIRARKLGADPHITPEATIIHHGGSSDTVRAEKVIKLMSGKVTVVKHHFAAWQRPLALGILRAWPYTRLTALTVLSSVTRNARFRAARDVWSEIWTRRTIWWNGYY